MAGIDQVTSGEIVVDGRPAEIERESGRLFCPRLTPVFLEEALESCELLAEDKLRVAAVFETPIEEPWVNQIHVALLKAKKEMGIEYVWIPLGGDDHPYTPGAVDEFAAALAERSLLADLAHVDWLTVGCDDEAAVDKVLRAF